MARVAAPLPIVAKLCDINFVGNHVVDHDKVAVIAENASHFGNESLRMWEVVWCDSAGDKVETCIIEWQGFGVGQLHGDVVVAEFNCSMLREFDHFWGEVGGHNRRNVWSERECCVPGLSLIHISEPTRPY